MCRIAVCKEDVMSKVSVMMPAYNAENYIGQALDSILSQDYLDIQIVVCDDASTDTTAEIIKDYQSRYPEKIVAILNLENVGVTRNCNLALEHCDGEFVSLFAGDDVMLPGKISKQVALMAHDANIVLSYHPVEIFDSDTGKTLFVTNQMAREDVYSCADMLLKGGIPGGCSIMVRKAAIPAGGYDSRLKTVSDWLFFLEISLRGKVVKIDETLARYRKHAQGASQQTYILLDESLYALDLLLEKHPQEIELPALVKKAKARYLAGETVRQFNLNGIVALKLAKDALSYESNNLKYLLLVVVAWFNGKVPGASVLIGLLARRSKYLIKRMLG